MITPAELAERIRQHGRVVRGGPLQWSAQCPAHDDQSPSLSIGTGAEGIPLVHCQAGCPTESVLDAVGLTMADLMPDRARPEQPRVVATYPYCDEHGQLLYEVRRIEPGPDGRSKTFRPYLPGASRAGLGNVRRVLYRLPEVIQAAKQGRTVYVCEGEKDADALAALGLVATCNPGGAGRGKWRDEYSRYLAGAHVIVVADRDEPGIEHARAVADALNGHAASVRIMLPAVSHEHADVSDHLEAGYRVDELVPLDDEHQGDDHEANSDDVVDDDAELLELAAAYTPVDWHALWERAPEEIPWLCEPLIAAGRLVAIYSPPKVGKSLITLEIAAALATGRPVLGNPPRPPKRVVYVDLENSGEDIHERLSAMGYTPDDLGNLLYFSFPSLPALDSARGGRHLLALAVAHRADLVVIDTVSRTIQGGENDADTFHQLYRHALAPLKGRGVAVLRLDHSGKDPEQGQRGSSAKASDVDAVWLLVKRTETSLYLKRQESRSPHGADLVQMVRRTHPLRHEVLGNGAVEDGPVVELAAILDGLGLPPDAGRERARSALAAAGYRVSNSDLAAAIRYRKGRGQEGDSDSRNSSDLSRTGTNPDTNQNTCPEPVPGTGEIPGQTCPGQVQDSQDSSPSADLSACPPPYRGDRSDSRGRPGTSDSAEMAVLPDEWGEWSA